MNIAIIGAGLIGKKRALALPKGVRLSVVCDVIIERAQKFKDEFGCEVETNWKSVVVDPNIDAVIVCTSNDLSSPIAAAAIKNGKHVLIEKPGARNPQDLKKVIDAYKKQKVVVMFGYNHRLHPAMQKAKQLVDSKKYGKVMFIRAKYGHGGRLGYEKEWRFKKEISGGGQLLDQGSHLVDLVNFFSGEIEYKSGITSNLFWKARLEDSAFILLQGKKGKSGKGAGPIASLSTTCVEWKNVFCFEIMLETAKIQIDGLGRSYGTEKLILYEMKPEMGPPDIFEFEFKEEDKSWNIENEMFFKKIKAKDYKDISLKEAAYVLRIIHKAYAQK